MVKKMFVPKRARVVRSADRWYIDYTTLNAQTGEERRHRRDFHLNEIPDLQVRQEVAERLARYLDVFLPEEKEAPPIGAGLSVMAAVAMAVEIKTAGPRRNTHKGYRSISKKFLEWMEKYPALSLHDFGRRHAREWFDHLQRGGRYSGTTINNCLIHMRAMWSELVDRELCTINVWKLIKPVRTGEKLRRPFTPDERRVVASYIQETDYWLFRGLLLQFFLYIRPVEMARLRFKNFDLSRGLLHVEGYQAKTWKARWVTIPAAIMPFFADGRFDQYPANFFVFGLQKNGNEARIEPATVAANENRMYKRHRKILEDLQSRGELSTISGLSWYSWKDTGISLHAKKTSLLGTKDQAGHSEVEMTMMYYHTDPVNAEYRALPNDLME